MRGLSIGVLLLVLAACRPVRDPPVVAPSDTEEALVARCCAACQDASKRDPRGMPVDDVPCAELGGTPLSAEDPCRTWALSTGATPASCRDGGAPLPRPAL